MKFFPLHASCLFFMLLNENFVDIERPGEMCSPIFVADEFSGMILHPTIFSVKHSRSA